MLGIDGTGDEEPLFRPYAVTGGRAEPRYHMAMETLVSSSSIMDEELALLTPSRTPSSGSAARSGRSPRSRRC
nr:hypothetical protein GCM10020093_099160 [Planobispora longispora]